MNAIEYARSTPGCVSVVIEGCDEQTVLAMAGQLAACHNISGPLKVWRTPGVDGVQVRLAGHLEAGSSGGT